MSQLGHSLCRTPRGELRGFPCRRVVSMAVDAAIAVSWPVAEALAERLCRIMVWLLRLALMRATDLARADACGPTAGMLVRQPIDPPASARADTLAARGMLPRIRSHFGRRRHHAGAGYRPGGDSNGATNSRPDSCAPTSIAELAEVHRKAHVGPEPDTMPASAPASTPARNARASAGSRLTAAACISLPSNGAS